MKRLPAVLLLLFLASLPLALHHDLFRLAWRQGREALRQGEHGSALRAFERAAALGKAEPQLDFDAGVAWYRLGEFGKARERFAAAGATAEPRLRAAALFNLGNAAFREAEKERQSSRPAAVRLLQQAAGAYRQVLGIDPQARDARGNLELAGVRLSQLAAGGGKEPPAPGAQKEPAAGDARQGKKGDREPDGSKKGEPGAPDSGKSRGERSDQQQRPGKPAPDLSRGEAERLLSEARGREALVKHLTGAGGKGVHRRLEKEW